MKIINRANVCVEEVVHGEFNDQIGDVLKRLFEKQLKPSSILATIDDFGRSESDVSGS